MKKILIIEDEEQLQSIYLYKLTASGYEVLQAYNGPDGIKLVMENTPDLILLDIMLPGGMNGFDILEKLKHDPRYAEIPVIVLTNLDTEKEATLSMGVAAYIVKSNTSMEDILKKIQEVMPQ